MIFPECKTEEILVVCAQIPKRQIKHLGGKSRVLKRLDNQESCTGLIDEDPFSPQPPKMQKYRPQEALIELGLKVLHNRNQDNRLVVLCPRLEEWIIDACKEVRIDIRDYNLPIDPNQLHKEARLNPKNYEKLVEDLFLRNSKRVRKLFELLSDF